jgi:glycosyltransferase involved in cell wall biosynthesis
MKVFAFPQAGNPYQRLLHDEMRRLDVEVVYLPAATSSQTLNILLLPWSLLVGRLRGIRILHIHWVYLFAPLWVQKIPSGRRLMQGWFAICLAIARILGYGIVWTAHNVLPHAQVFANDRTARQRLAENCDVAIVHNRANIPAVRSLGAEDIRVIEAGSYIGEYPDTLDRSEARHRLSLGPDERVVSFVGLIETYKGIDWLLEAADRLPHRVRLRIVIAGRCRDEALLDHLRSLAAAVPDRVITRFEYVPDDELQVYLRCADLAVFPLKQITNSSSVLLALSFGVPVLIPAFGEFDEIPQDVAVRYEPGLPGLVTALSAAADLESSVIDSLAVGARSYAESLSWERCAKSTIAVYHDVHAHRSA